MMRQEVFTREQIEAMAWLMRVVREAFDEMRESLEDDPGEGPTWEQVDLSLGEGQQAIAEMYDAL
jgi:hypothetical protein